MWSGFPEVIDCMDGEVGVAEGSFREEGSGVEVGTAGGNDGISLGFIYSPSNIGDRTKNIGHYVSFLRTENK